MPYKNDLEELFQKAGENYPLKTGNSNWDDLSARLTPASKTGFMQNRFWKFAALLILLTGGSLALYKVQEEANQKYIKQQQSSSEKTLSENKNKHQSSTNQTNFSNNQSALAKSGNSIDESVKKSSVTTVNYPSSFKQQSQYNAQPGNQFVADQDEIKQQPLAYKNEQEDISTSKELTNPLNALQQNDQKEIVHENLTNSAKPVVNNKNVVKSSQADIPLHVKQSFKIYGSLFGGPEFSTVKFQKVIKPGYRIGVALGYRINKSFNVEIGLQREHINFYSDGKYIDTSMLRIKSSASIESVNGSSKVTSVPLKLRYNFPSKSSNSFYATAGVNAVIITHNEQYSYMISKDGVEGNLSKKYSSLTDPKYFTGIIAGVGYEKKISNWCNLKVEPYYQSPISDFGIGKLSVTNFGVDIGIVKNLK